MRVVTSSVQLLQPSSCSIVAMFMLHLRGGSEAAVAIVITIVVIIVTHASGAAEHAAHGELFDAFQIKLPRAGLKGVVSL